jgi:hypothetical protein
MVQAHDKADQTEQEQQPHIKCTEAQGVYANEAKDHDQRQQHGAGNLQYFGDKRY